MGQAGLCNTGEREVGEATVQVYRPTVILERLKLRRGPRPTVSVVAVLLVQV